MILWCLNSNCIFLRPKKKKKSKKSWAVFEEIFLWIVCNMQKYPFHWGKWYSVWHKVAIAICYAIDYVFLNKQTMDHLRVRSCMYCIVWCTSVGIAVSQMVICYIHVLDVCCASVWRILDKITKLFMSRMYDSEEMLIFFARKMKRNILFKE